MSNLKRAPTHLGEETEFSGDSYYENKYLMIADDIRGVGQNANF